MPNQTAVTTSKALVDRVIARHGAPKAILTDRGRNFTSDLFKNFIYIRDICEYFGIDRKFTTAYHPQTDGQTERFNRTLMGMLCNYIGHKHDDWEDVLELVCFVYRASVHSPTCETPYFLLYGRDPRMLIDRFLNPRMINIITPEDYKSQLMMRMHTAFKLVKDNLEDTRKQVKIQYDKRAKVLDYKVGDKVLLDIRVIPIGLKKK